MHAFMQSLQIRWPVPGHIGLSIDDQRQRADRVAGLAQRVHLGDLLVERTAVQLDAERVHRDRSGCRRRPCGGSCRPFEHESLSRSWQSTQ